METDNSIQNLSRNLEKTGQQIVPMTSKDFFSDVSEAYDIEKNECS